jgi:hypothetical protein
MPAKKTLQNNRVLWSCVMNWTGHSTQEIDTTIESAKIITIYTWSLIPLRIFYLGFESSL